MVLHRVADAGIDHYKYRQNANVLHAGVGAGALVVDHAMREGLSTRWVLFAGCIFLLFMVLDALLMYPWKDTCDADCRAFRSHSRVAVQVVGTLAGFTFGLAMALGVNSMWARVVICVFAAGGGFLTARWITDLMDTLAERKFNASGTDPAGIESTGDGPAH